MKKIITTHETIIGLGMLKGRLERDFRKIEQEAKSFPDRRGQKLALEMVRDDISAVESALTLLGTILPKAS